MRKRRICWLCACLLAVLLIVPMLFISAAAAADEERGSCGENVTYAFDASTGTLTISGTGAIDFYGMAIPWYSYSSSIVKLVVEEGVTSIPSYAFLSNDSLTSVVLPDSLISIGDGAFWGALKLSSVSFGSGLEYIGQDAFAECAIEYLVIPSGVTEIQNGAFDCCTALKQVTLHGNVTSIGSCAFRYCHQLENIVLPESLESIGAQAFAYDWQLKVIRLPTNIKSIGNDVFYDARLQRIVYCGTAAQWNAVEQGVDWMGVEKVSFQYHSYDSGTVTKHKTCTTAGAREYRCVYCNATKTESIPAAHSYGYGWKLYDEAQHQAPCEKCDYVKYQSHIWGNDRIVTRPTCTSEGLSQRTCMGCGEKEDTVLVKTPHVYPGAWTSHDVEQHKKSCTACSDTIYEAHAWDGGVMSAEPTHLTSGERLYTCTCGQMRTEVIEPLSEHAHLQIERLDALQHQRICECGDVICEAHSWNREGSTQRPDESKNGISIYICLDCGASSVVGDSISLLTLPGGCSGTVIGSTSLLSIVSLAALCLLKRKKER